MRWHDVLPIIAVLRDEGRVVGYALGWVTRLADGTRAGHLEHFRILRPWQGSLGRVLALRDAWDRACRRRGLLVTTTRVLCHKERVQRLAVRFGPYIPFASEGKCIWYWRSLA